MPNLNERQFQEPQLFEASRYDVPEPTLDDQYEDAMRDMASYGVAQINVHPHSARGIIDEGEILSQHYTGKSEGVYSPHRRSALEEEWGLARPVYGTVQVPRMGVLGNEEREQYGDIAIALKRSTRPRTTVTHGDSLALEYGDRPEPIDAVAEGWAAPVSQGTGEETEDYRRGMVEDPTRPPYYEWMEAQIEPTPGHRGVDVSEFREVHIPLSTHSPEKSSSSGPRSSRDRGMVSIGKGFEDIGVPAYLNRTEQRYQPPLPYSDEELIEQGFSVGSRRHVRRDTDLSHIFENVERVDKSYRAKEFRRGTQ